MQLEQDNITALGRSSGQVKWAFIVIAFIYNQQHTVEQNSVLWNSSAVYDCASFPALSVNAFLSKYDGGLVYPPSKKMSD